MTEVPVLQRVRERLRDRTDGPLTRVLLLLVAAAIILGVGPPALGMGVLHPSDVLQLHAPWASDAPPQVQVHNTATSDTVDATVPVRVEQRRRMLDGDLPLWSELQAGGAPLAAIPNSSAFSPLTAPWYVLPLWLAPAASKLLEMAVAGLFIFLFVRRIGLSRPAGLVAALAYVNSGFQVVWTNWPQSHIGALIPALFWAVDRAVHRARPRDLVPLAFVSATMWFEGFPALTLWAHTAAGAYAAVALVSLHRRGGTRPDRGPREHHEHRGMESDHEGRVTTAEDDEPTVGPEPGTPTEPTVLTEPTVAWWRRGWVALSGVVLGAAVAAVQLVPFAFRLTELDVTYRYDPLKIRDLPWKGLLTLGVPDAFGNPVEKVYFADKNYVELVAFVGVVTLLLAAVGLAVGRATRAARWVRWTFATGAAVALWLAFIGGPVLDAFQQIPVIGPNAIGRMRALLGFCLAVLAAVGVDGLLAVTWKTRSRVKLGGLIAALAVGTGVLVAAVADEARTADRFDYFLDQLVLPGAVAAVALVTIGLLLWTRRRSVARPLGIGVLAVLLAVETVSFASTWMPDIDRDEFYPRTDAHRFLAANLGEDRFAASGEAGTGFTFIPGTTTFYDLRSITAHSLTPEPYADLLRQLDRRVFSMNRTYPVLTPGDPAIVASPVLDRMGTRFFAESPAVPIVGDREVVTGETERQRLPAGRSFSVEVPPGPLRGVELQLHEPVGPQVDTRVKVEIFDGTGELVAEGKRRVFAREDAGRFGVAVAPLEDWPDATGDAPWTVRVALDADEGALVFGIAEPGRPALSVVRPTPGDGLEVVFTDGVTIYGRDRSLPRIRWAGDALSIADADERVATLASSTLDPGTVVLSSAGDQPVDGATADVVVTEDSGDRIAATVQADGAGYLVVADTLQDGWVATVDGERAPVVDADHAFVAVPVPAGEHRVELSYRPRGARFGGTVTVLAMFALIGAIGLESIRRQRTDDATDLLPWVGASDAGRDEDEPVDLHR